MNKMIIAGLAIAGLAMAAEYPVSVTIPVKTEVVTTVTNVTESVSATAFVLERFIADVENPTNVSFRIVGSYRDAAGVVIKRKTIPVPLAQARLLMPEIGAVMTQAQGAIEANIGTLLGE